MKYLAIITARMTSSRLPGKVMMKIKNTPIIKILIDRLRKSKLINSIAVSTTTNNSDDILVNYLKNKKIKFFRGSEEDVTKRVIQTSNYFKAKNIVLITGDCPLIDPNIVDQCIRTFDKNNSDFVTNVNIKTFPDGMDVQVFKSNALKKSYKKITQKKEFEHVSLNLRRTTNKEKIINITAPTNMNFPQIGLTLDEINDFILIKKIITHFWKKNKKFFTCFEILEYLFSNKNLIKINSNVKRKGDK